MCQEAHHREAKTLHALASAVWNDLKTTFRVGFQVEFGSGRKKGRGTIIDSSNQGVSVCLCGVYVSVFAHTHRHMCFVASKPDPVPCFFLFRPPTPSHPSLLPRTLILAPPCSSSVFTFPLLPLPSSVFSRQHQVFYRHSREAAAAVPAVAPAASPPSPVPLTSRSWRRQGVAPNHQQHRRALARRRELPRLLLRLLSWRWTEQARRR